jgi:2-C-methyl-D-erythritol 4-phosphate cytidylyltransferase/2-C-methyl-D-erythritol 2,4-cyclodiphosphate synthase
MQVTAIIAAGGSGRRLGASVPKQLLDIGGRTLLERSIAAFTAHPAVGEVIVALPADVLASPPASLAALTGRGDVRFVAGGERRQDSVANAFDAIGAADIVLVHDAARPFVSADVITRAIEGAATHGVAIVAVPVADTVKRVAADGVIVETLQRDEIFLAQTPQAFKRSVLGAAIAAGRTADTVTDEAMLAERAGHKVHVVAGDSANVKITTASDLERARADASGDQRIGIGYDLHRLVEGRPLVLGGLTIPAERGALGHSDADVVCHSVTDAILGAARAGDIGQHYPDSDPKWKGASSIVLLKEVAALVRGLGFVVANVDVVVILERPKLGTHRAAIESSLACALGIDATRVSVKAKTNEGVDAVGRGEAIAAQAVALLTRLVE